MQIASVCDCCPSGANLRIAFGMTMCKECHEKELRLQEENKKQASARVVLANNLLETSRKIDASIELREDLYNAQTVSNIDLKNAIESDPSIENKQFAYAVALKERFEHFTKVIFDARKTLTEANNKQRAIQTELNELANKLRHDEREKLKLADLSYTPNTPAVKPPKTGKPKTSNAKLIREMAAKYGVPSHVIQLMVTARNMDPEKAAIEAKRQLGL